MKLKLSPEQIQTMLSQGFLEIKCPKKKKIQKKKPTKGECANCGDYACKGQCFAY